VNLTSSNNNRVFGNTFWYNALQAYDVSNNNLWDDGYPQGGNFWSDFDEAAEGAYDNLSGPSQNEMGSDGIVDSEYSKIGGGMGVMDNYPLISPGVSRTYVYMNSPINNSVVVPGTILDFIVVGDNIDYVNYTFDGGSNVTLDPPYDINDTVTGGWSDGSHIIEFFVYHLDGRKNMFWFNITIDSILPEIHLNTPVAGALITPGTDIDLSIFDENLDIVNFTLDDGVNSTISTPYDIDTGIWNDGNRTIVVYAKDLAGNLNFTTYNFTIDGTSPKIKTEPPTVNDSTVKPGTILLFNITDTHLDTGTIFYTKNGGPDEYFNFTTFYEINTTGWLDDVYLIEVSAMDVLGNLNVESFNFIIDGTPPAINLTSPTNNSILGDGDNLNFDILDENIDWVRVYENGIPSGIMGFPYIWNITGEPDGPYTVRVDAQDLAGNFQSRSYNFTIAIPPRISLEFPSNDSLIKPGMMIELHVEDSNLLHVNYSMNFGSNITLNSPYDINTSGWADGPYFIEVHAIDTMGNSNISLYFFTVDSTPPTIFLTEPLNNSHVLPGTDLKFEIIDDNIIAVTNSTNGGSPEPFSWPYWIDTAGWNDGLYNISIMAVDGQNFITRNYFIITIDSVKPVISLISPPNGSSLELGMWINLSIIEDNLDFVNYSVNSMDKGNISFPFSISSLDFPDGSCNVRIYAEDKAGNFETKTYLFIINDTTEPEINLISPQDISFIFGGTQIEFEIYDLSFKNASYSLGSEDPIDVTSSFTIDTASWTEGEHTLMIWAYDNRGNMNVSQFLITIDSQLPEINFISPSNNSVILPGIVIQLGIFDENLDQVSYFINGGEEIQLPAPYTISTNGWTDDEYTITIEVRDKANNMLSVSYNYIVDSIKPSIILNQPANGSLIRLDSKIDFSVLDENIASVFYTINNGSEITFSNPYDLDTTELIEGVNIIKITAEDLAGNSQMASYTFILDSVLPTVESIFAVEPHYPYEDTRIIIRFSEPMNTASVEEALKVSSDLQYTLIWYNNGQELWLDDITGLEFDGLYTVNFESGVTDLAGNPITNFTGYSFIATIDIYLDSDGDGMPDGWEFYYGLDPDDPTDAAKDLDGDGYTNLEEFKGGSDPSDSDSIPTKSSTPQLDLWWLIPILVTLLIISIVLFIFLLRERKEEPKGPVEEVEDMYLAMRAEQDIKAMEEILADKENLGERIFEAEIMVEKAKGALEKGDYNVITVYEQTLRNLLMEIDEMEGEGGVEEEGKEKTEREEDEPKE
jgi:hypothetical protein